MASKYSKKNQSNKKTSVREFKAWLSGVEEMQPLDWVPDASQWKVIRAKIDTITEEQQSGAVVNAAVQPFAGRPEMAKESTPAKVTGSKPTVKRVVDQSAPPTPPAGTVAMAGMKPDRAPPLIETPDGKIKTPDIDTSKAGYKSPFV